MKGHKTAYEKLNWTEVNEVLAQGRVALLPTGSIEGHGPHAPLDTDAVIADGICNRVARKIPEKVIVLPPLMMGLSSYHMDFPGTLTLSETTYIQVVYEICSGLVYHGFTHVLIINGHGGNQPALDLAARRVMNEKPNVLCGIMAYYLTPKGMAYDHKFAEAQGLTGSQDHAGFGETSCYLAFDPEPVDMSKAVKAEIPYDSSFGFSAEDAPVLLMPYWSSVTPLGVMGDPRGANAEDGNAYLDIVVDEISEIVEQFQKMKPSDRSDHHDPQKPAWGIHQSA
jgi:creatinine amidohydrolase